MGNASTPAVTMPGRAEIEAIAGHQFAGGEYTIAHWENVLLTGCTGADLLPDGMAHPIALFHLPITGAGTSIADMFALGQAESDLSIMIESYDWEYYQPLREEQTYRVAGRVQSAERCENEQGQVYDRVQFVFDVSSEGETPVALSTITWHFTRGML